MTVEETLRLWPLAKALHEARRDLAWGKLGALREPWPEWSTAYSHNPIAYVDLALAQAEAAAAIVETERDKAARDERNSWADAIRERQKGKTDLDLAGIKACAEAALIRPGHVIANAREVLAMIERLEHGPSLPETP